MTDLIDISQLRPVEMGSHRKDTKLILNTAIGVGVYLEQATMQNTCNFIIAVGKDKKITDIGFRIGDDDPLEAV